MIIHEIYQQIKDSPGWLAKFREVLDDEDLNELEKEDQRWIDAYPRNFEKELDRAFSEWEKEYGFGVPHELSDSEKLRILSKKISDEWDRLGKYMAMNYPSWLIKLCSEKVKDMEKYRNKIQARKIHRDTPESFEIPEWKIVKARQYPLENLTNPNRAGRIKCEWHEDNDPSMYVKNGWGYCFSCGKSANAIDWMMDVNGYTFKDAVNHLVGGV